MNLFRGVQWLCVLAAVLQALAMLSLLGYCIYLWRHDCPDDHTGLSWSDAQGQHWAAIFSMFGQLEVCAVASNLIGGILGSIASIAFASIVAAVALGTRSRCWIGIYLVLGAPPCLFFAVVLCCVWHYAGSTLPAWGHVVAIVFFIVNVGLLPANVLSCCLARDGKDDGSTHQVYVPQYSSSYDNQELLPIKSSS